MTIRWLHPGTPAHVRGCARCQSEMRFAAAVDRIGSTPARAAPRALLDRALASRGAGERRILGSAQVHAPQKIILTTGRAVAATIAASIVLIAVVILGRPVEVAAGAADSELRITPENVRPGDTVRIEYRPGGGLFPNAGILALRARLRVPGDGAYSSVPPSRVRRVALLRRTSNGVFEGYFVLPDSVVFAAMAVEDTTGTRVDDNARRLWEVLAHGGDGNPLYDALEQRVEYSYGRSWEEGYGTAKELTRLYPEAVGAWELRESFERFIYGDSAADSLGKAYKGKLNALIAAAKARPSLSSSEIGTIFFRKYAALFNNRGTPKDSIEFRYWLDRLRREYPHHPQLAQYYATTFSRADWNRPRFVLDSLEKLYPQFTPIREQGRSLLVVAIQAVSSSHDDSLFRIWRERWVSLEPADSAYQMALALTSRPSLRKDGMTALRALLAGPAEALISPRGLQESAAQYLRRAQDARRTALAALGRALVSEGHLSEALDTLRIAARGGAWDLELFRTLAGAFAGAGDSAAAERIRVRLAVDPRTPVDTATVIRAAGHARLGVPVWDSLANLARREMYDRLLTRSVVRAVRGTPTIMSNDGRSVAFRDLTANRPAVVIFWSRHCAWALEALPAITSVAERLDRTGKRVVFVVDDETPSNDLRAFMHSKKWTLPIYYDGRGELKQAFANFGTPAYYVLDSSGRIRFDWADGEAELIAQLDAITASGGAR